MREWAGGGGAHEEMGGTSWSSVCEYSSLSTIAAHLISRKVVNCQKVVAMAQDEDNHSLCLPEVVEDCPLDGARCVLDHLL